MPSLHQGFSEKGYRIPWFRTSSQFQLPQSESKFPSKTNSSHLNLSDPSHPQPASIECPVVFEVAHVYLELRNFAAGDVGRIRDDQIEGLGLRSRCKVLPHKKSLRLGDVLKGSIFPSYRSIKAQIILYINYMIIIIYQNMFLYDIMYA